MNSKDRQTFLATVARNTEDRIKRYRALRAGTTVRATQSVRDEMIAKGIIKPTESINVPVVLLTGMDRARELTRLAIAEVK